MNFKFITCCLITLSMSLTCCGEKNPDNGGDNGGGDGSIQAPKGKILCSGNGVASVVVTDGTHFTKSADDGSYELPYNANATHVYISTPAGYTVGINNSVPIYWKTLEMKDRSKINFELIATGADDKHYFVAVGDPQIRSAKEGALLEKKLAEMKQDIATLPTSIPVHLMITGDLVFNTMDMNETSRNNFHKLGQPVYSCIGNHDHEPTRASVSDNHDKTADKVYKSHYGPTYYSFNRGKVHYIALDNIFFKGGPDDIYDVKFTNEQLKWVKGDLQYVPKSNAVVVMAHSPTQTRKADASSFGNSAELHALLRGYANVQIITGHTHYNTVVQGNGMMEHVIGALCGGFWESTVCLDGSIMGYKIFEVDNTAFKWEYKGASERKDSQFTVFTNSEIPGPLKRGSEILVNVWDWDSNWTVQYSEDGGSNYKNMAQATFTEDTAYDPTAYTRFGTSGTDALPSAARQWIKAGTTDHLFYFTPTSGINNVIIKVVTRFDKEFTENVSVF